MLKIGSRAPAFCLPDQDGNKTCIGDSQGKWVILYFYPKDNTSGCTLEAISFTEHLEELKNLGAMVVGVSPDTPECHRGFIKNHNLKIPLLSDTGHSMLEKYGVWQMKKMYGREYFGVVRTTFLIDPEGKIAYIWDKVKVAGHIEEVKEKLSELAKK